MQLQPKLLVILILSLLLYAVVATYDRSMVRMDYIVEYDVICDPTAEKCYVNECDNEPGSDGTICTGNPDEDIWYTKTIARKAYNVPRCTEGNVGCLEDACGKDENDCLYTWCDQDSPENNIVCSDPKTYDVTDEVNDGVEDSERSESTPEDEGGVPKKLPEASGGGENTMNPVGTESADNVP